MCCRSVLVLVFMCVADIEAHVVDDFRTCPIFYKGYYPHVEFSSKQTAYKYICQQYRQLYYFATVYLPEYRIPLFSAYQLDGFDCKGQKNPSNWFIEPQLFCPTESPEMNDEGVRQVDWKVVQAVKEDYRNTNYDKGHLNPTSYHCDSEDTRTYARTATFTLTNAVPQDPIFNQKKWKDMEQASKKIMQQYCLNAQSFFVTGVIPSDMFIPFPEQDSEDGQQREYYRVNVPSAMWTAACCGASTERESFSFGYYGRNGPYSYIMAMPITRLLHLLRSNGLNAHIFHDNCMQENYKSRIALERLIKTAKNTNAHSFAKMYIDLNQHTYWH